MVGGVCTVPVHAMSRHKEKICTAIMSKEEYSESKPSVSGSGYVSGK